MQRFAPHLTKDIINKAMELKEQDAIDHLFDDISLPHF